MWGCSIITEKLQTDISTDRVTDKQIDLILFIASKLDICVFLCCVQFKIGFYFLNVFQVICIERKYFLFWEIFLVENTWFIMAECFNR